MEQEQRNLERNLHDLEQNLDEMLRDESDLEREQQEQVRADKEKLLQVEKKTLPEGEKFLPEGMEKWEAEMGEVQAADDCFRRSRKDKLLVDSELSQADNDRFRRFHDERFRLFHVLDEEAATLPVPVPLNKRRAATLPVSVPLNKRRAAMEQCRAQMEQCRAQMEQEVAESLPVPVPLNKRRAATLPVSVPLEQKRAEMEQCRAQMEQCRAQMEQCRAQMEQEVAELKMKIFKAMMEQHRAQMEQRQAQIYRTSKKITFTQDVQTDQMKTGNIMLTESYLCDSPVSHKIRSAVKREKDSYKVTIIPSSDRQNQQRVWPVRINAKLSVVKDGVKYLKGSLEKSWKKEDLSNVYKDFDWTNSIEVPFADLEKDGTSDATDSSVTFYWDVDVSVSALDGQSQPPTTTQVALPVKTDQMKTGYIMWTESYPCKSPVSHRIRSAVKREKDSYKVTLFPSSDLQNQQFVWPVRLDAKLSVVKDGVKYLKGSLKKSWEKEDLSTVYKDFDWTNSIEVPFADLDKDGVIDATDSSVTFYWDVDVSVSAPDCQSQPPTTTQGPGWFPGFVSNQKITFTQDVKTDQMKTGNIMWTESYPCDWPVSHKIRGAVKREKDSYKLTIIPSSDRQNKQWPVLLNAKLYVVKDGVKYLKGPLEKSWKKEDLSTVYKNTDWTNSIEVPFADLDKDGMIDATDSSVTFHWDVDVSVSAPGGQSQPPSTTQATANSPMESLKIACHRKDEMMAGDRVAKTVSATKKFQHARVKRSASVGCSRDESLGKAKAKKIRSSVEVLQPGQDEQQQFEMVTVLAN